MPWGSSLGCTFALNCARVYCLESLHKALDCDRDGSGFAPCALEMFVCRVCRQSLYDKLLSDGLYRWAVGVVCHVHSCSDGSVASYVIFQCVSAD